MGLPLLTGAGYADPVGMTIEKCATFYDNQPVSYRFMGITDGFQCCMSTAREIALTFSNIPSVRQCLRVCFREPPQGVQHAVPRQPIGGRWLRRRGTLAADG